MKVIRQLLCPVDLSERSAEALRYARALRSLLNAQLAILYVVETDTQQPDEHRSSDSSLAAWVSNVIGLEALDLASAIAAGARARLLLVHVLEWAEEVEERLGYENAGLR